MLGMLLILLNLTQTEKIVNNTCGEDSAPNREVIFSSHAFFPFIHTHTDLPVSELPEVRIHSTKIHLLDIRSLSSCPTQTSFS